MKLQLLSAYLANFVLVTKVLGVAVHVTDNWAGSVNMDDNVRADIAHDDAVCRCVDDI